MKIISKGECREWLAANFRQDFTRIEDMYPQQICYSLPVDTGAKTAIARSLSNVLDNGLFWITEWEIFPSAGNMALFDGYRKSLGELRPVDAAPGHIFEQVDKAEIECLLGLALYFFWDASIYDRAAQVAVEISHDEFVSVHSGNQDGLAPFQDQFEKLKLRRVP